MELHFSWGNSVGTLSPSCSSSTVNKDGVSPLACLLTDDGGQLFLDTVSWLSEDVNRIRSVRDSKIDFSDWSRGAWGGRIN